MSDHCEAWRLLKHGTWRWPVAPRSVAIVLRVCGERRRGKQFNATRRGSTANRAAVDLKRNFPFERHAFVDRGLHVFVSAFGRAFTEFVTGLYWRTFMGWRTTFSTPTEFPMDALEVALWARDRVGQATPLASFSTRVPGRVTRVFATPSASPMWGVIATIGTVGDGYDNAHAENVVRPSGTGCLRFGGPFRTQDEVEHATPSAVHWFNNNRLHSVIRYVRRIEIENRSCPENAAHKRPFLGDDALYVSRADSAEPERHAASGNRTAGQVEVSPIAASDPNDEAVPARSVAWAR